MANNYIPQALGPYLQWSMNFSAQITLLAATVGVVAADVAALQLATAAYTDAYEAANQPATRSAVTVAARNTKRAELEPIQRQIAQSVAARAGVTPEQLSQLGLTVPKERAPVVVPNYGPELTARPSPTNGLALNYQDPLTGRKQKPEGVAQVQIYVVAGMGPAVSTEQGHEIGMYTKSPVFYEVPAENKGKTLTFFARWVTTSGPGGRSQYSPWGTPISVIGS